MRLSSAIGLIALGLAAAYAAIHPREVIAFYQDAYPGDPARRQALDMCIRRDRMFNRADAAAREACYRQELGSFGYGPADAADTRFVDFYRDAGRGHQPTDDIRAREQNQRYTHPIAAPAGR